MLCYWADWTPLSLLLRTVSGLQEMDLRTIFLPLVKHMEVFWLLSLSMIQRLLSSAKHQVNLSIYLIGIDNVKIGCCRCNGFLHCENYPLLPEITLLDEVHDHFFLWPIWSKNTILDLREYKIDFSSFCLPSVDYYTCSGSVLLLFL